VIVPPAHARDEDIDPNRRCRRPELRAVVLSWIAGFAGFLNCDARARSAPDSSRDLLALAIAPLIPLGPGGEHELRAVGREQLAASMLIVSGIVSVSG